MRGNWFFINTTYFFLAVTGITFNFSYCQFGYVCRRGLCEEDNRYDDRDRCSRRNDNGICQIGYECRWENTLKTFIGINITGFLIGEESASASRSAASTTWTATAAAATRCAATAGARG